MKKRCEKSLTVHFFSGEALCICCLHNEFAYILVWSITDFELTQEDEMEEESQFSGSNSEVDDEMDMDTYDA
jgi:hypothetical protein